MAKVTMTLEGMDALQAALRRVPDVVLAHAADAVAASAFAVAQRARALAPRRTGALRNAITSSATGPNGRVGLAPAAGVDLFYWRFQEFGTINHPPHPFFRPAADEESSMFIQRIRAIGPKVERDLTAGRFR